MIALLLALLTMLSGGAVAVDRTHATGIRTERSAAAKAAPRPLPTPSAARPLAG
jgi:hypothetical protein